MADTQPVADITAQRGGQALAAKLPSKELKVADEKANGNGLELAAELQ